jgi:hypothetical protein
MKIRQAVGNAGTLQAVIETVRGYGYRVTAVVMVLPPEALAAGTVSPDQARVSIPPVPGVPSLARLQERAVPNTVDGPAQAYQVLSTSAAQSHLEVGGPVG